MTITRDEQHLAGARPAPWFVVYESCGCDYCTHGDLPYAIRIPGRPLLNGDDTTAAPRHDCTEIADLNDDELALVVAARNRLPLYVALARAAQQVDLDCASTPPCGNCAICTLAAVLAAVDEPDDDERREALWEQEAARDE